MANSSFEARTFEGLRGGVTHRYEVRADALHYSATDSSSPKEVTVPWREFTRIRTGARRTVYLVRRNKQSFGIWIPKEQMPDFWNAALKAWAQHDGETARKAAFDYGESGPGIGWLWLLLTAAFPGMLTLILLTDGYHERMCTRLLDSGGRLAPAHISKIKKNRRGNYIWTMDFEAEGLGRLTGTRESPLADPMTGLPIGSKDTATVIYSPENKSCWDLSLKQNEKALNHLQRAFVLMMDLSFGWIFAIVTAIAGGFSVARISDRRPYRETVRAAGEKI